jgi:GTP pyrophosphokinase
MAKRAKRENISFEQLESDFRLIAPTAEEFRSELTKQISKILEDNQIILGFPLESRVKKWNSIVNKLERLSLSINEIKELNDLVGFRLILLFRRDLSKVCDLLRDSFNIIEQYDTQERLKEDQFGYSSIHFVVSLPESWLAVPTLASMGGIRAEVQVRTVAQHIWAAASHELQYKQEASVPLPIRRAIYRVSALLETVDLEFERVLEQRETYRKEISTSESLDILNVDLLEKIFDDTLPARNKRENEMYSSMLSKLLYFNIDTEQKLRKLVESHLQEAMEEDAEKAKQLLDDVEKGKLSNVWRERLEKGMIYSHVGLVNRMLRLEFGVERWKAYGPLRASNMDTT